MYQELPVAFKIASYNRAQRRGDVTKIAEETGYSRSMVSRTLRGLRNNTEIVNKGYRLIRNRQSNLDRLTTATA
jgi:hypothetical protein